MLHRHSFSIQYIYQTLLRTYFQQKGLINVLNRKTMAVKHNLILQIFHTIKLAYTKQSLIYIVKNEIGSLSRILDFFKIPNLTIRLKPYQLSEITLPAIAHCQTPKESYFVLLQSFTISQVVYYQEDKGEFTEALEAFAEKWSGNYGSLTDCLNAVGVSGGCNCKSTSK